MSPTSTTPTRFPNRIADVRRAERLKLAELARIANVSRRHLTDIEAGRKIPSVALLHDIATALHTTMQELLESEWSNARHASVRAAEAHAHA